MNTPVVFLVFNRPELTARVFARIRQAQPEILFIIADGPRAGRIGEVEKCAEVRRLISAGIDWPCRVVWECSDVNLGCARRVSSGLNVAFAQVEEAIILEDDCLPDPTFFRFCEELLVRYRDEQKVAQIAGCSFQDPMTAPKNPSYYFSRYPHCWGWATWRRAWLHYDHKMQGWNGGGKNSWLTSIFNCQAERRWWTYNFNRTAAGVTDSWAFRWTVTVYSNGWFGILPYQNLVSNIGFGADGTHTAEIDHSLSSIREVGLGFPLHHPAALRRDERADEYTSLHCFRMPGIARRVFSRFRRLSLR